MQCHRLLSDVRAVRAPFWLASGAGREREGVGPTPGVRLSEHVACSENQVFNLNVFTAALFMVDFSSSPVT